MPFFQLSFLERLLLWPRPKRQAKMLARRPAAARQKRELQEAAELKVLWNQIRQQYFPERPELDLYKVCWSPRRQKRVLGSCNIHKQLVRVASELKHETAREWLEPLLYHEMCHAALGLTIMRVNRKRAWHGAEFKQLEMRHPKSHALDAWIKSGGWRQAVRRDRALRRS